MRLMHLTFLIIVKFMCRTYLKKKKFKIIQCLMSMLMCYYFEFQNCYEQTY